MYKLEESQICNKYNILLFIVIPTDLHQKSEKTLSSQIVCCFLYRFPFVDSFLSIQFDLFIYFYFNANSFSFFFKLFSQNSDSSFVQSCTHFQVDLLTTSKVWVLSIQSIHTSSSGINT